MSLTATVTHTIPFHDVDVMHIAWHGHYFKYFEMARTALMQKLGFDWPQLQETGIAMPVIKSEVQYRKPLHYNQTIAIEASIHEPGLAALETRYVISDVTSHDVLTTAVLRQAYVCLNTRETLLAVPDIIEKGLRAYAL